MKRLLLILLLAAGTAHGQINNPPTSVNIVDSTATGRAVLTATNAAAAATAISLGTTNDVTFNRVATTASGNLDNLAIRIGATNTGLNSVAGFLFGVSKGEYVFGVGPTGFSVTPPATFITNVNVNGSLVGTGPATFSTNVTVAGTLTVGSLATTTPSTWALDAVQTNSSGPTSFSLALTDNGNVIRVTNAYTIENFSNGRLGAFYYLVNQSGNSFAIENTNGITVQGGRRLTLAANEVATLVATGPTNVSVANRGDLTDVALGGTANTAPSQTASSGSSLMTRDLVDKQTLQLSVRQHRSAFYSHFTGGTITETNGGGVTTGAFLRCSPNNVANNVSRYVDFNILPVGTGGGAFGQLNFSHNLEFGATARFVHNSVTNCTSRIMFGGEYTYTSGNSTNRHVGWRADSSNNVYATHANGTNYTEILATNTAQVNQWYHIAANNGSVVWSVNGTQVASTTNGPTGTDGGGDNGSGSFILVSETTAAAIIYWDVWQIFTRRNP